MASKKKSKKKNNIVTAKMPVIESKQRKKDLFPVIGIGASAGGLEALEIFFTHIPARTGMAYIVVTHLDRDHVSMMTDLIKKYTSMPVFTIVEGVEIMPNTIYVIPPRKNIAMHDNVLHLVEQTEPHYSNLPINFFFRSLALDRKENAAAIILSGSGSDGSLGAREIKLNGGLVIAQNPASAKFDSMPTSIVNMGIADFILPPENIPEQLLKWANYKDLKNEKITLELQHLFTLIRSKTGYDFSSYKLNTLTRCIKKQMLIHHLETLSDYILLLKQDPKEVDILFRSFLIGVTRFFRDPKAFVIFKKEILPNLFKKKPLNYPFRIWIPGCSTGEEAYSIAICIAEYMQETKKHYPVQIFGTDIDSKALTIARSGTYPDTITHDISAKRLAHFFTKEKNKYKIKKEIRSMIIFGEQNITKDPPFTKVDIISCRNLLIYLNAKLQKKILPIFHYSLKPKGILFLGMSESISGYSDLFELANKNAKFFVRKNTTSSQHPSLNFPDLFPVPEATLDFPPENHPEKEADLNLALKKFLLDNFVSPCLVVNKKGEILYSHGKLNYYVRHFPLAKKLNVDEVVPYNIKMILKSALRKVLADKKAVTYQNLLIKHDNGLCKVNLRILAAGPITGDKGKLWHNLVLIFFEEPIEAVPEIRSNKKSSSKNNTTIIQLQQELSYTKENLQATIEELESSNEELQSMNEELQSTNEEIETSKEELHALNEELVIMNTELQSRIDQLASVNDDMTNLFNSTEIATFFLDNNLCIKRFTPKAQEFIHLMPTDIGRSITHFASTIKYEKLEDDAKEVLRTLNQKTIEVQGSSQQWYLIRILPYRTLANMIDGVVITFTNITAHKAAERKLTQLNNALENALSCSKNIIDTVMIPLLVLTTDLKIISANRAFYKNFPGLPEDTIGKFIYTLPGLDMPELRKLLEKDFPENKLFEGFQIVTNPPNSDNTKINFNARKIFNNELGSNVILLAMELK